MVKLGYAFQQDGKKLYYSFSIFKHKFSKFSEKVLDIDKLALRAQRLNPQIFPKNDNNEKINLKGLSKLTFNCFGKPLDKRECMSNWSNIPLRKEQLRYAAIDALVLIEIFDFIQNKCKNLDIDIEKLY